MITHETESEETSQEKSQVSKTTTELAQMRNDLAVGRNVMGADRTLMAWVRTALSLNSFGFTIYKILQGFQSGGTELHQEHTPRNVGLFMTGMGTIAMVMGTIEYWYTLKELRKFQAIRIWRATFIMALLMSVIGVLLFFSIVDKLF